MPLDRTRLLAQADELRALLERGTVAQALTACARFNGQLQEEMPPSKAGQAAFGAVAKGMTPEDIEALETALAWFPRAKGVLDAYAQVKAFDRDRTGQPTDAEDDDEHAYQ